MRSLINFLPVTLVLTTVLQAGCDTMTAPASDAQHPNGNISEIFSLGGRPHGISIAESGTFVVSQIDGDMVTKGVIRSNRQTLSASITVGDTPAHVAVDRTGRLAYTTNQYGSSISVVDLASDSLQTTIPLSDGGFNLLLSRDGFWLYATTARGILHAIDTRQQEVVDTLAVGEAANGLAIHEPSQLLYVSSRDRNRVTAVSTTSMQATRTYVVSPRPQRIAVSNDGAWMYVANESNGLEVLDTNTGELFPVEGVFSGAVGLALSPDEQQIYLTYPRRGLIQVVDVRSRSVQKSLSVATSPRNVAFTSDGSCAIVTDEDGRIIFIS